MDFLEIRAVTEPIDRIIAALRYIALYIFRNNETGFFRMVIQTILQNEFLLVGLILTICGFSIGILKRLISS